MSGYLQRLVVGAMTPSGSIQPMVGSLFSAPRCRSDNGGGRIESSAISAPSVGAGEPVHKLLTAQSSILSVMRDSDISEFSTQPNANDYQPQRAFTHERTQPLVAAVSSVFKNENERLAAQEGTRNVEERAGTGETGNARTSGGSSAISEAVAVPERGTVAGTGVVEPDQSRTLPEKQLPMHSSTREIVPNLSGRSFSGISPDSFRRSASVQPEVNEIQIEIGRIEVTALAASSHREIANPAPKRISLDEYLKRKNRRAL